MFNKGRKNYIPEFKIMYDYKKGYWAKIVGDSIYSGACLTRNGWKITETEYFSCVQILMDYVYFSAKEEHLKDILNKEVYSYD